jgi:hypothetical protein
MIAGRYRIKVIENDQHGPINPSHNSDGLGLLH